LGVKRFRGYGAGIYKTARWKAVRKEAKDRDGWKCADCGARGRLEVHHIKPIRTHPELAYDLDNLKSLGPSCHHKITIVECGLAEISPERKEWRELLRRGL
jgi:5-methylcytosine-specific restriction protein A